MGMDLQTLEKPKNVPAAYAKQHTDPGYYRFNVQGMAAMVSLMDAAGVTSSEAAPPFPAEPKPKDPALQEVYEEVAGGKKEPRAKLSAAELQAIDAYVAQVKKVLDTRSATPGKVPAFKFQSNEGWHVTPDECRLIARAMRDFAGRLSGSQAKAANAASKQTGEKLTKAVLGKDEVRLSQETGMSIDEMKTWVLDWADYNTLASFAGGYAVY